MVRERGDYQSRASHFALGGQGQLPAPGPRRPPVSAESGVDASLPLEPN